MKSRTRFLLAAAMILLGMGCSRPGLDPEKMAQVRTTPGLYFVDAHSQMDHDVDEERVISLMDHGGVYRTILASHLRRRPIDIVKFAKQHPGRIVPAVRIKGGGYHSAKPAAHFYKSLDKQARHGGFRAMGEVLLWHASKGGRFQAIRIGFDDALVQAAFQAARGKGWPFIVHIEFGALSESGFESYMTRLEAFLSDNRDHPVVMIHMGQLEAQPVAPLLARHPNLHFMTSHADRNDGLAFIDMLDGARFKPEWQALIEKHPDRFVFALDNVFSKFWMPNEYLGRMSVWWRALSRLPDDVAHAVAHGNAERLWNLAPKPRDFDIVKPWESEQKLGPVTGYSANRAHR